MCSQSTGTRQSLMLYFCDPGGLHSLPLALFLCPWPPSLLSESRGWAPSDTSLQWTALAVSRGTAVSSPSASSVLLWCTCWGTRERACQPLALCHKAVQIGSDVCFRVDPCLWHLHLRSVSSESTWWGKYSTRMYHDYVYLTCTLNTNSRTHLHKVLHTLHNT